MKFHFKDILVLVKFRISFASTLTAELGYILSSNSFGIDFLFVCAGVFFLASGSCALNQVQEWKYDKLMQRTFQRPIPQEIISPRQGFIIASSLLIIGLSILFFSSSSKIPFYLGLLATTLYNFVYTPLKRLTAFASIPGALIGAIPPLIGWSFGGEELLQPLSISLAVFFFVWQIPHFFLLLLVYEKDYTKAGFPVLTNLFSTLQIARISFILISILVLLAFVIVALLKDHNYFSLLAFILLGILLLTRTHKMVKFLQPEIFYKNAFVSLNVYVFLVTLILFIQKFIYI
ncbi:MAG: protoheme IX farnesyltransferase [Candidatus Kapaibacteriota bacterium]